MLTLLAGEHSQVCYDWAKAVVGHVYRVHDAQAVVGNMYRVSDDWDYMEMSRRSSIVMAMPQVWTPWEWAVDQQMRMHILVSCVSDMVG